MQHGFPHHEQFISLLISPPRVQLLQSKILPLQIRLTALSRCRHTGRRGPCQGPPGRTPPGRHFTARSPRSTPQAALWSGGRAPRSGLVLRATGSRGALHAALLPGHEPGAHTTSTCGERASAGAAPRAAGGAAAAAAAAQVRAPARRGSPQPRPSRSPTAVPAAAAEAARTPPATGASRSFLVPLVLLKSDFLLDPQETPFSYRTLPERSGARPRRVASAPRRVLLREENPRFALNQTAGGQAKPAEGREHRGRKKSGFPPSSHKQFGFSPLFLSA